MNIKAIIAAAAFAVSLAACTNSNSQEGAEPSAVAQSSGSDQQAAAPAPLGPTLPPFILQNVHGQEVNLQDFKGKKVFVNLWASWCPPCRAEMPSIQKLAQSVDSNKVAFVLLALDDDFSKSKSFVLKQKLSLPIYYPGENLPELFNVQGIPTTFIFNEKGALIGRIDGGDDYDTEQYRKILQ